MTWDPPDESDSAVRGWMETQDRHDVAGECYTLRITRRVIEDTEPLALVEVLNFWKVAEMLRKQPDAYTLVKSSPTGVVVEQLPDPPS